MPTFFRPLSRRMGAVYALALLAACSPAAQQQTRYTAIEIGALGGVLSYANGINDHGVVVGNVQYADGHLQAFEWDATHGTRRIDPAARQSTAFAINNAGQIAGSVEDENHLTNAVVWSPAFARNTIAWGAFGAAADAINRKGEVVGYRDDGMFGFLDNAFSWPALDPSSAWNDLFSKDSSSFATGINDRGQIVGYVNRQAFLLQPNGTARILAGSPYSGAPATAVAINNRGDVIVSQMGAGLFFDDHKTLALASADPIYPMALNDKDQVVGYAVTGGRSAFVWSSKIGLALLDYLVDTPNWTIFSGNAINRDGVIAGYGFHNGRRRAVVLVPQVVRAPQVP